MSVSSSTAAAATSARDHGFHPLRVRRLVNETPDAISIELEIPAELEPAFRYRAGQFVTFRLRVDGEQHLRSYSMASAPDVDDQMTVTVKRVPGGVISNWLADTVAEGDILETTRPAGMFCLDDADGDVVGLAAGSGITPVYSVLKTALAATPRRVRLLYANRDRESVIFGRDLDRLCEQHRERFDVVHHLDDDSGFVESRDVEALVGVPNSSYYVCGPVPFMDLAERTLLDNGVDASQIHIERFSPLPDTQEIPPPFATNGAMQITIELAGEKRTGDYRPGTSILQTARQMGMKPPYSCENGDCATCMAKVIDGSVTMRANNALFDDEIAEGWVLTCQGVPESPHVHVVYED
jgi:3-ketosteroid 9alpha-monooxygenase subunit B